MKRLSPEDITELRAAEELLSRGAYDCGVLHEDLKRDQADNLLFILTRVAECEEQSQHLGCPHFLAKHSARIKHALALVLDFDDENYFKIVDEILMKQLVLDTEIRQARMGGQLLENLNPDGSTVPSVAQGSKNAAPHLEKFRENCIQMQALCDEALSRIRAILDTQQTD